MGNSEHDNAKDEQLTPFGAEMCKKHFLFDKDYVNLNHGSFGTYPSAVRTQMRAFQDAAEARPDDFIRYKYPPLLDESRAALAKLLNVPMDEIVIIPNATTGVNTVLRNLHYEPGEKIVYFPTIYGACEKTIEYLTETTPLESVKVKAVYPMSDDAIVEVFRDTIRQYKGKVKVALYDTVSSMPAVRMPFERLTEVAREEGVLSLIDGAHGIGHIHLDLGKLDADFFVSNCHKWLPVPRGCCVFHVPKRNQRLIRSSLPTSHGFLPLPVPGEEARINPLPPSKYPKSEFVVQFEFVGTLDNAPYLCVPSALKFREEVCGGEERIIKYCTELAREAGELTAKSLGTEVLDNEEHTMTNCCFANVRLPLEVGTGEGKVAKEDVMHASYFIARAIVEEYNTFIAVFFYNDNWWVRLSGQIYLERKDFVYGAEVLKEVCERVKKGEYLIENKVEALVSTNGEEKLGYGMLRAH